MPDLVYGVHCEIADCYEAATGTIRELKTRGWIDYPRKGQKPERYKWRCPKHGQKPPSSMGRTTP